MAISLSELLLILLFLHQIYLLSVCFSKIHESLLNSHAQLMRHGTRQRDFRSTDIMQNVMAFHRNQGGVGVANLNLIMMEGKAKR